ncbi:SMC-Scp complex subunit ScpB [Shewanella sp. Isolate11]|uniref:SMC-Scp complex subunit ScpB n=1 Tax=Shewanella sp. Isolate11 TaxID=2908530 RepID=UPI001EFD4707|nr:SMC-Scp complex subunit ScpB [Shewanella sp. Isolate11]MCG9696883.1 SMC-Scp complex subunit ScpB [Shewanella sp. Isolate11]
MQINQQQLKQLIEASLFVMAKTVSIKQLIDTVLADFSVSRPRVKEALQALQQEYQERGINLVNVAGGYRFQTIETLSPYLQRLWQEKAPKYSRATLETLAVIAYRQPVTRGDIELVRGVAVGSHTIKSLSDRDWIKIVGHKEVPGRPALYATTSEFLAYFGLDTIADLPALSDAESLAALFSGVTNSKVNLLANESTPETTEESTNE